MTYPKPYMSVSELAKMGLSKTSLYQAASHHLAYHYIIRTAGGGKILFDTEQFEKYKKYVFR